MKNKKLIIYVTFVFVCIAIIATIIVLKTKTNKKVEDEQLNAKYEEINQIDEENMKIDNEIEDISSQLGQLEQQIESEIDEGKKEEIKNKIKELQEKKQSLNDKKEENNNKKNETIIQIDKIKEDVQLNTINSQQTTNESNNNQPDNEQQNNEQYENKEEINEQQYTINVSKLNITLEEGQETSFEVFFTNPKVTDLSNSVICKDSDVANIWCSYPLNNGKTTVHIKALKVGTTQIEIEEYYTPNVKK